MKVTIDVNPSNRQDFKAVANYIRLDLTADTIAEELYQWAKRRRHDPTETVMLLRKAAMLLEDKYKQRPATKREPQYTARVHL